MNYILADHKTGATLTSKLTSVINKYKQLELKQHFIFHQHYIQDDKYIIVVRNPKEIIISGYLWHKVCHPKLESWAFNSDHHLYSWYIHNNPHINPSEYVPQIEKASEFSKPITYNEKLNTLPETDGIILEMNSVAKLTIDGMYSLPHYGKSNTLVVKLEDLMFNADMTILKMCTFLGIDDDNIINILKESAQHNIIIKKEKGDLNDHNTNKDLDLKRYNKYWNKTIDEEFKRIYPEDILSKYGYFSD